MSEQAEGLPSIRSNDSPEDSEADREASEGSRVVKKIDRLSLLPNELLDQIFDTAYFIDTPSTGALSKRLLPFHITGIYRRIRLYRASTFVTLIACLRRNPKLGAMTETLDANLLAIPTSVDKVEGVDWFYSQLPRITEISITGRSAAPFGFRTLATSASHPSLLPLLQTITTPFFPMYPCPFRSFTTLPALRQLHITQFDLSSNPDTFYLEIESSASIDTVSIDGNSADHPAITDFCRKCSNLVDLSLTTAISDYRRTIPYLPERLTHLSLWSPPGSYSRFFIDPFLPRFPNLVQLAIGTDLFSDNVTQNLASLSSLESLKLGRGFFNTQEMIDLIVGFGGFDALEYLYLDTTEGVIGFQVVPEHLWERKTWYRQEDEDWEDWCLPEFTEEGGPFSLEDAKELVETAEGYGVTVEGNLLGAIVTMELYLYEVANLAILRSYLDADLSYIETLQTDDERNLRLPSLDLDSLDPANLQLIKREPPEDDWAMYNFNLSLKNRGRPGRDTEDGQNEESVECELVYDEEDERLAILWKL